MSRGSTPGLIDQLWRVAAAPAVLGVLVGLSGACLVLPRIWIPEVIRVWVAVLAIVSIIAFGVRFLLEGPRSSLAVGVTRRVLGLQWWALPLFDRELVQVRRQSSMARTPLLIGASLALTGALLVLPLQLLATTLAVPPTVLTLAPGDTRDHGMAAVGGEAEVRRMLSMQVRLQALGEDQVGRRVASIHVEDTRTGAAGQPLLRPGRPLRVGPWVLRLRAIETVDTPGSLEVLLARENAEDVQLVRLYRGQSVSVAGTDLHVRWVREASDVSPVHGLAVDVEVRDDEGTVARTRLHEEDVQPAQLPALGVTLRWSSMSPTERALVELRPRSGELLFLLPLVGVLLLLLGVLLTFLSPVAVVGRDGDAVLVARAGRRWASLRPALPVSDAEWDAWTLEREEAP